MSTHKEPAPVPQGKRFFIVRDERNLSACRSNPWRPLSRPFLRREDANAELPTYVRWYGPCIVVARDDGWEFDEQGRMV